MGGGSGGHVTPIVAVLNELKRQLDNEPLTVSFICDKAFEEQARRIMATADVPVSVSVVSAGKLRRYAHFKAVDYIITPSIVIKNAADLLKTGWGFLQALVLLLRKRPDVVFAKGGYVCLPVGWAAGVLKIPLVIHDSDARPGLTNRMLAPFAHAIATGYPLENYSYDKNRSTYTGVPTRDNLQPVDDKTMATFKRELGVDEASQLVVALGGGLGSRVINDAVLLAAPKLADANIFTILIAGKAQYEHAVAKAGDFSDSLRVLEFVSEGMTRLLAAADVVVSRASATALQELAGLAKPIIAVPARQLGDQQKNAALYVAADAAIVLTDTQLEAGELQTQLIKLLGDAHRRDELSRAVRAFSKPNAAHDVAALVVKTARAGKGNS